MDIQAIIFDKDGTLLDFDAFWVPVTVAAVNRAAESLDVKDFPIDAILTDLGVHNGVTDIDGILCKGTYAQIAGVCHKHFGVGSPEQVKEAVMDGYNSSVAAGEVKPVCENLIQVLQELTARGLKLFVVTTDNRPITDACLAKLGISDYFTDVFTDDGRFPTKPDPACAEYIMTNWGIARENVLMVGDTGTDARFAENAGISAVGVAKSGENAQKLARYMDKVVPNVSYIPNLLT